MPLDFLKRKGNSDSATETATAGASPSPLMPEEVVAQDHILKLYYAGKSSDGVRHWLRSHQWKSGPTRFDGGSTLSSGGISTSRRPSSSP